MSAKFVLSAQAERDIDDIAEYIARDSVEVALRFYDATWRTFGQVAATPGLGRPRRIADPDLVGLRSASIEGFRPFLVFYLPTDFGVRILRVLHGARDLEVVLKS